MRVLLDFRPAYPKDIINLDVTSAYYAVAAFAGCRAIERLKRTTQTSKVPIGTELSETIRRDLAAEPESGIASPRSGLRFARHNRDRAGRTY